MRMQAPRRLQHMPQQRTAATQLPTRQQARHRVLAHAKEKLPSNSTTCLTPSHATYKPCTSTARPSCWQRGAGTISKRGRHVPALQAVPESTYAGLPFVAQHSFQPHSILRVSCSNCLVIQFADDCLCVLAACGLATQVTCPVLALCTQHSMAQHAWHSTVGGSVVTVMQTAGED